MCMCELLHGHSVMLQVDARMTALPSCYRVGINTQKFIPIREGGSDQRPPHPASTKPGLLNHNRNNEQHIPDWSCPFKNTSSTVTHANGQASSAPTSVTWSRSMFALATRYWWLQSSVPTGVVHAATATLTPLVHCSPFCLTSHLCWICQLMQAAHHAHISAAAPLHYLCAGSSSGCTSKAAPLPTPCLNTNRDKQGNANAHNASAEITHNHSNTMHSAMLMVIWCKGQPNGVGRGCSVPPPSPPARKHVHASMTIRTCMLAAHTAAGRDRGNGCTKSGERRASAHSPRQNPPQTYRKPNDAHATTSKLLAFTGQHPVQRTSNNSTFEYTHDHAG
jgi:hypothetical protein